MKNHSTQKDNGAKTRQGKNHRGTEAQRTGLARLIGLGCLIGLGLAPLGCSSTPGKFESFLFNQQTNWVTRVAYQTNVVTEIHQVPVTNQITITKTNEQNVVIPTFSNYVTAVEVPVYRTNVIATGTNAVAVISESQGAGAGVVTSVGGVVGDLFGVGGIVKLALGGLMSGFLVWRNRQFAVNAAVQTASVAQTTAETFAQNIETLKSVIKYTPQGQKLAPFIKDYLVDHQREAGVLENVATIIDGSVSEGAAKTAADAILNGLKTLQA